MTIIEGFGDEVTYGMMVLLAIVLITACWLSTQLRFIPFVNVFILESMQDFVDTNAPHSDIVVVPVAQEVPAEAASPPADDTPQTSETTSENTTDSLNTQQAEAIKNDNDATATEEGAQREDTEKVSPEDSTPDDDNISNETQDSTELASSDQSAENVAHLETQLSSRKVNIKLISMNNTNRIVQTRLTDTIGDFRRSHFEKELSENKTVRFIFHGKCLANDRCTLESCNIKRDSVIHCLVTPSLARRTEETASTSTAQPANIENGHDTAFELILYPSIIIVFAVLWYLQFTYEQVAFYPCIMILLGVSFFLLATSLAIYRTMRIRAIHRAVYN